MKVQIVLFTFIYQVVTTQVTSLNFEMNEGETLCFQESIPEKTIAEFDVSSTEEISIVLQSQDGIVIAESIKSNFKQSFTTEKYGYYQICITNSNKVKDLDIYLTIRHGVGMRDFSSLARAKDLKPIDIELKKISEKHSIWNYYKNMNIRYDRTFDTLLNSISSNIVLYSVILIGVMIVVGLIETIFLKKFMQQRKII